MRPHQQDQEWTTIVDAGEKPGVGGFRDLLKYKDLIWVLVKKYFQSVFRQTYLGPIWIALNPIFSTLIFALVLGHFAKMPSDGMPIILFYLAGGVVWGYFSNAFSNISNVLLNNQHIIKKVAVPKIILPVAEGLTALTKFLIVLAVCVPVFAYFVATGSASPNVWLLALPLLLLLLFLLTLGLGLTAAALMVKYRDLGVLIPFLTSSVLFLSPILYPTSIVPSRLRPLYELNPLAGIIECLRFGIAGHGSFTPSMLLSSVAVTALIFVLGLFLFKRVATVIPDHI